MNSTIKTLQIIYEFFIDPKWGNKDEMVSRIHAEELQRRLQKAGVLKEEA